MGTKNTDYKRQFNANNYDRIHVTVRKGEKVKFEEHAKNSGESLNSFANRSMYETMERDNKK